MAAIFRFVDPASFAVNLDLRSATGWYLGEGLNIGKTTLQKKFLSQDGVDGVELASSWKDMVNMSVPLIMRPQATAAAMETLVNALNTELDRAVNCIEYLPDGLSGTTFKLDTLRTETITIQDGSAFPSPWLRKEGLDLTLSIDRQPAVRGRATVII